MSFKALSNQVMLAHSDALLHTPALRNNLDAHPLGAALAHQLQLAHDELAAKQNLREQTSVSLDEMSSEITQLDHDHDRFARGFYWHLGALAECAASPQEAESYLDLQARLFPDGLNVVRLAYLAEAGAIVELEQRVTPELRKRLGKIRVGERTLGDIYQAWVDAGKTLGRKVRERARLQESLSGSGTAVAEHDTRAARRGWVRIMSALMNTIDLIPMSKQDREAIIGPVEQSMRAVDRNRGGNDDVDENDDDDLDAAPIVDGSDDDASAAGIGTSPIAEGGESAAGIGTSPIAGAVSAAGIGTSPIGPPAAKADTPAP